MKQMLEREIKKNEQQKEKMLESFQEKEGQRQKEKRLASFQKARRLESFQKKEEQLYRKIEALVEEHEVIVAFDLRLEKLLLAKKEFNKEEEQNYEQARGALDDAFLEMEATFDEIEILQDELATFNFFPGLLTQTLTHQKEKMHQSKKAFVVQKIILEKLFHKLEK